MKFKEILKEDSKFDKFLYKKEYPIFRELKDQHIKELKKEIEKLVNSKLNARLDYISIEQNFIFSEVSFNDFKNDDDVSEIFDRCFEYEKIVNQALKNIGLYGLKLYCDSDTLDQIDKTLNIDMVIFDYNKDYIKNLDKKFDYLKDYLKVLK